jgi:hypothetical protein
MASFILAIVIMYNRYLFLLQSFSIHTSTSYDTIYTWRCSLLPLLPLLASLYTFSTYLAPSICDRNRPPPSQVACKLTLFAPPFTQLSHPPQTPRTPTSPNCPRLTTTTLGLFRPHYAEHLVYLWTVAAVMNIVSAAVMMYVPEEVLMYVSVEVRMYVFTFVSTDVYNIAVEVPRYII